MFKRRRLILGSVISLLLFGYFLLWITGPSPGINRQGFDRITLGMTEEEVIRIVQAAPGDYITGKPSVEVFPSALSEFSWRFKIADYRRYREDNRDGEQNGTKEWLGDGGVILVHFDADDKVAWKMFRRVIPQQESFVAMLRRWLRL